MIIMETTLQVSKFIINLTLEFNVAGTRRVERTYFAKMVKALSQFFG